MSIGEPRQMSNFVAIPSGKSNFTNLKEDMSFLQLSRIDLSLQKSSSELLSPLMMRSASASMMIFDSPDQFLKPYEQP